MLRPEDLQTSPPVLREKRPKYSIPIIRATCERPVRAWITSKAWRWTECHFWGGKHIPCLAKLGSCPCEEKSMRRIKIGWCCVLPVGEDRQGMFSVSASMLEYAPELLDGDISRRLIECHKECRTKPKSRNILRVEAFAEESKPLPPPLDVDRWLCDQLYRAHAMHVAAIARRFA